MKLLIHACCADCVLKFLESKSEKKWEEMAVYYYNPNIQPRSEYLSRLKAIQKVLENKEVKLIIPDWSPREYFEVVKTEKGRCVKCWNLRLGKTAEYAKKNGFEYFSSTLVTSQYQNRKMIEVIANKLAAEKEVKFFVPKKVCCDLKTAGFYKQFYCGCVYSLKERFEEKYKK